MAVFKCKMCGGSLEVGEKQGVVTCDYCGTKQTFPKTVDDNVSSLFNRANSLRLKNEFDKAQEIYEKIISTGSNDPEAFWGNVLCKYGIEYVEDPVTLKRVPTCHRTQIESVLTDVDYTAALEHADDSQKAIYEAEAKAIDELQKDILAVVDGEEPFDVFICYKETDEEGKRTQDSVIANDIYHQLTQEGLKVFYAAITLEDKLGQEYEPYIFAALNSAKVMLVVGTKPEYFNAVWVRNEWSRFLKIIKSDRSKSLIPCYRDMDAYDLPEEFSHLQAQNMSKLGFMQDIIRGIKKLVGDGIEKDKTVNSASKKKEVKNDPESIYNRALSIMNNNKDVDSLEQSKSLFDSLNDYKDAKEKSKKCAEKIKKRKRFTRSLTVLLVLLLVVALINVLPRVISSIRSANSVSNIKTEAQINETQESQSVNVSNLKLNRSEDDRENDYGSFENPISRIYFHFTVELTGMESTDLLCVIVLPNGEQYDYLFEDVYTGDGWQYSYGHDTEKNWATGNYQFKIYDNNTNKLLVTRDFSVIASSNNNQPANTTPANANFETLTFSGEGAKILHDIYLPQGSYKVTLSNISGDHSVSAYFYNKGEEVWDEYINADSGRTEEQIITCSLSGYISVEPFVDSDLNWSLTIEAY